MLLYRVYHICDQMSKIYLHSPIIYYIALFQTLKRNYAMNVTKMYYTCVFFYLCVTTYRHKQSQSCQVLPTYSKSLYDKMSWGLHIFYCTVFNANDIFL